MRATPADRHLDFAEFCALAGGFVEGYDASQLDRSVHGAAAPAEVWVVAKATLSFYIVVDCH